MKKKIQAKAQSRSYKVGYRQPPAKYQFRKGESGNPSGKRKGPSNAPDLKAQLEGELNKTVTIRSGKRVSKAAAGIEQLVDQFVNGDRNARRDVIVLCEKLGINLTNLEALESALEDALSAEDEALLADFVKRHGGQYPIGVERVLANPARDANILKPPIDAPKLLTARPENSTDLQMAQPEENSDD